MMGPMVGGMARQLEIILGIVRENKVILANGLKQSLGQFQSMIHTLRVMAYEAAAMLDSDKRHSEFLSLILASRYLSGHVQSMLDRFITESGLSVNADFEGITHDIRSTGKIAQNVSMVKLKKLGESLL